MTGNWKKILKRSGIIQKDVDILVIAGDLTSDKNLKDVLYEFSYEYEFVFCVLGNHEFYGTEFEEARKMFRSMISELPPHVDILENGIRRMGEDIKFLGTSLWFKEDPILHLGYKNSINDFKMIKRLEPMVYQINDDARKFLEKEVDSNSIVITHHAPSFQSIAEKYRGDPINNFFVNDLDGLIYEKKPKLWIHGHTHHSFDYNIGDTRVVCNPFGYFNYAENENFRNDLIIEI